MNSVNDPVVDSGLCSVSSNSSLHSQDYLTEESDISRKGIKRADSLNKDDNFPSDGENGEDLRHCRADAPFGKPVCYSAVVTSAMELIDDRNTSESITCPEPEPIPCSTQASVIEKVEQELHGEKPMQHSEEEDDRCSHRNEQLSSEDIHHSGEGEATGDSGNGKKKKKRKKKKKKAKEETSSGLVSPAESVSSDQAIYPKDFKYHGSPDRVSLVAVDGKYVTGVNVRGKYMVQRTMNQVKIPVDDSKPCGEKINAQEVDLRKQAYRTNRKESRINETDNNIEGIASNTAKELTEDSILYTKNGNKVISRDDSIEVMPGKELSVENDSSESGLGSCEDKSIGGHYDDKDKRESFPVVEPEYALDAHTVKSKLRTQLAENDKTYRCETELPGEDSFELVENKRKKRQQKMQSEPAVNEGKFDTRQKAKGNNSRYRTKGSYVDPKNKLPFKDNMNAFHHFAQVEGTAITDIDHDVKPRPYARKQRPSSAKASERRYEESAKASDRPTIGIHISRSEPHLPLKNLEEKVLSRGQLNGIVIPHSLKQNFFPKETYSCTEALNFKASAEKQTLTRSDSLPEIPVSQEDFSVPTSHSDGFTVDDTYASRLKKNLVTLASAHLPTTENSLVMVSSVMKENEKNNSGSAAMDSVQTSYSDVALQPVTVTEKELPTALQVKPSENMDIIQFLSAVKTEEINKKSEEFKWSNSNQKPAEKSGVRSAGKGTNKGIYFPLSDPGALGGDEDLGITFGTVVFKSGHLVIEDDKMTEVEREKHECAKCEDCRAFNHKDVARFLDRAWKSITKDTSNEGTIVYYSEG